MSLSNIILQYLKKKYPAVIHKGELGRKAVNDWGYENENLGRRCRELENSGVIKRIPDEKGRVMYQYIPFEEVKIPRVLEENKNTLLVLDKIVGKVSDQDLLKYL